MLTTKETSILDTISKKMMEDVPKATLPTAPSLGTPPKLAEPKAPSFEGSLLSYTAIAFLFIVLIGRQFLVSKQVGERSFRTRFK